MYAPLITVSAKSDVAFEKYLVNGTNYNHFCQLNSTYLPSISCIPTSYMMLKKIVYPNAVFTGTELVRIAKGMGVSVNLGGTSLVSAGSFAKSDIGCGDNVVASSNIITSIEYIKSSLNSGKPLLAVTNLAGKHIVGIVGIKVMTNNNNSVIYYVDPLAKNAGVKEMNLINFLTSMRSASDYGLHNLLKIGC